MAFSGTRTKASVTGRIAGICQDKNIIQIPELDSRVSFIVGIGKVDEQGRSIVRVIIVLVLNTVDLVIRIGSTCRINETAQLISGTR